VSGGLFGAIGGCYLAGDRADPMWFAHQRNTAVNIALRIGPN